MKPRDIWIEFGGDPSDDKEVYKRYSATIPFKTLFPDCEVIHCREVRPIDWEKVWKDFKAWSSGNYLLNGRDRDIIEELIEKQLIGEGEE